jgi:hypothetical protein
MVVEAVSAVVREKRRANRPAVRPSPAVPDTD